MTLSTAVMSKARVLHATTSAAMVTGWLGAALAWGITSGWTDTSSIISSYARLDQLVAAVFGACTGACVLALRARHRREPVMMALGAGALLGGVAATLGATIGLLFSAADSPTGFVFERVATWALMCACASAALATYTRTHRVVYIAESFVLGTLGGATAGALFCLPGPAEVWLPLAMTWGGAALGFAAIGPAMWRARAVVHVLPARDAKHTLWSLHERALEDGWSMEMAEAQVGCVDGAVFVYPPPVGAVLDGYPLYRPLPLTRDVLLAVGRARCRVSLGRARRERVSSGSAT